jgi:hypothetical protein
LDEVNHLFEVKTEPAIFSFPLCSAMASAVDVLRGHDDIHCAVISRPAHPAPVLRFSKTKAFRVFRNQFVFVRQRIHDFDLPFLVALSVDPRLNFVGELSSEFPDDRVSRNPSSELSSISRSGARPTSCPCRLFGQES